MENASQARRVINPIFYIKIQTTHNGIVCKILLILRILNTISKNMDIIYIQFPYSYNIRKE